MPPPRPRSSKHLKICNPILAEGAVDDVGPGWACCCWGEAARGRAAVWWSTFVAVLLWGEVARECTDVGGGALGGVRLLVLVKDLVFVVMS